jgi:hypothetical protein
MGECRPSAAARYLARSPLTRTDVASWLTSVTSSKCPVQRGPEHAAAGARPEGRLDLSIAVEVANPVEGLAFCFDAQVCQVCKGVRHHAFTAGLVDGPDAPFDDGHLESSLRAVQCGGQSRRTPAADEQVDHDRLASAAFSTVSRVLSRTAFKTVKTTAVIHAVCTRGSAMPSTTTAT